MIKEIHRRLLVKLKIDLQAVFPQIYIERIEEGRIDNERIYLGISYKGDKHEWGQVRMCTYDRQGSNTPHHFIATYTKDYRTVDSVLVDTHEEVIDFFAQFVEKKNTKTKQLSLF